MKRISLIVMAFVLSCSLISCGKSGEITQPVNTESVPRAGVEATAVVNQDRAGNEIVVPKSINRIISMAPSITEMILEMGLGSSLVAVDYNAKEAEGLNEDVVVFDMMAPDIEKMVSLKPDIVFTSGMSNIGNSDPFKVLKDLKVCVADIPTSNSIKDIEEDIIFVANVLGVSEKGAEMVAGMQAEIDKYAQIGSTIEDKKSVYFELGAAPDMYSFGSGVFLDELLGIIGATNAFSEEDGWLSVSDEAVPLLNPDVILTNINYIDNAVDEIKSRKGWGDITAIKNNEVYYIDNNSSAQPNQNIVKAMKEIAKAVYPDKY